MKLLAFSLSSLFIGIVIGYLIPKKNLPSSQSVSQTTPPASSQRSLSPPTRTRLIDRETPPLRESPHLSVPVSLLTELSLARSTRTTQQDLFDQDDLSEKALTITDSERASLQQAWRHSQQQLRDLEAASVTRSENDDGSLTLSLPDLSASSNALLLDFNTTVQDVLGENRAQAFLAIKQINQLSSQTQVKTYTIIPERTGDVTWRFHITQETPDGKQVWVGEQIPDEVKHLTGDAWLDF